MQRPWPTISQLDILDTQQRIDRLTVVRLKEVAKAIGLALSGRKADLQSRIKAFFNNGLRQDDTPRLLTVRTLVLKCELDQVLPDYQQLYTSFQSGGVGGAGGAGGAAVGPATVPQPKSAPHAAAHAADRARPWLYFKESPFFRLKRLLHGTPLLAKRAPESRGTCTFSFVMNESESALMASGPQYRMLVLSGAYHGVPSQETFIEFPAPIEVHVNGVMLRDNLKGIKNRPGTARPADITTHLHRAPASNKLNIIYAFSKVDYLMFCYIVEKITPEQVLEKVRAQPHIARTATAREIRAVQDHEDDLVEMQEIVSLRCPLTYGRLKYPAKSLYCKHVQCFDALSFLQLQEQAATWSCPICQREVTVKTLAIDDYMAEVIAGTGADDDAVELLRDGSWKVKADEARHSHSPVAAKHVTAAVDAPFVAKREDSAVAIPLADARADARAGTPNAADGPEIISLDSSDDADGEDDDDDDVIDRLAREVHQEVETAAPVAQLPAQLSPVQLPPLPPPSSSPPDSAPASDRQLPPPPLDSISFPDSLISARADGGVAPRAENRARGDGTESGTESRDNARDSARDEMRGAKMPPFAPPMGAWRPGSSASFSPSRFARTPDWSAMTPEDEHLRFAARAAMHVAGHAPVPRMSDPASRVNLGFSLETDADTSRATEMDFLASPTASVPRLQSNGASGAPPYSGTTVYTNGDSELRRSPSRFSAYGAHSQPAHLQPAVHTAAEPHGRPASSPAAKRSYEVVDLVSSEDDDLPLAKR